MTKTAEALPERQAATVALKPAFCSISDFEVISGISRRKIYELLGTGDLKAVKAGAATLIDVDHGLAWLRSLPPAQIRAPRKREQVAGA